MHTSRTEVEEGESSEAVAVGDNQLKIMTPEVQPHQVQPFTVHNIEQDILVFIVRDLTTSSGTLPKHPFYFSVTSTVQGLLTEVARTFRYEVSSFSLIFQRVAGGEEQIDIHELDPEKCLGELHFNFGPNSRNTLILCDLNGYPPRKVDDDDLTLGASASPTSSAAERMWYEVSPSTANYESTGDTPRASASHIKHETIGYVGLVNQAMTCYLNSLLQTLFMTPEFRNALYRWEFRGTGEEAAKSIPFQLQRLFLQLQTATRTAVETTNLTKSFGWDSSEVWQQHDIQELYRVMFDALEQCFKNTDQADLINNLYEGKMKDYVKCLDCLTENAREDSFLDIPLPIRPFGANTAYKSVEEALIAFVEPEVLTGNNKYECSKCKTLCDAHKGLKFTRFPYLLTLHLKRFDFDYQTFHRIKLNDKVTFPNLLDLNAFVADEVNSKDDNSQSGSPDKCSTDKLDDASTTDSGSALEEESSSVEFATSAQTPIDTDTQDEDEGIDVSSVCNEKNKQYLLNGPYVYELFSIMVHSGSASGGHYYAYIKDFQTGEWYCFNDQSVSKITYDDIRKTYGGSSSRGYYSSWSSSANAYMLMYRQADKNRNAVVFSDEEFPPHIKELVQKMITEEAAEKEAKEIERLMCRVKLFCQHPQLGTLVEKKLKVHKDTTLRDTTKLAYQELNLENVVPLERCRLVKYEELHDNIECSFENQDNESISEVLGGVRSTYKFDLFMEIRDVDKEFEEYKPGGITVKVYEVNIATEEVEGPHIVRACQNMTVRQFKELIGRKLSADPLKMRVVQERYYNELKPLSSDSKLLRDEGFYRSNKVYIEASGEEAPNFFCGSQMFYILDRYEHTVTLHCKLPDCSKETLEVLQIPPYVESEFEQTEETPQEEPTSQVTTPESVSQKEEIEVTTLSTATSVTSSLSGSAVSSPLPVVINTVQSSLVAAPDTTKKGVKKPSSQSLNLSGMLSTPSISPNSKTTPTSSASAQSDPEACLAINLNVMVGYNLSDSEDEGIVDMDGAARSSSAVNSDQSASEDSSLTSDSDRTLVGDPPDGKISDDSHSPDYHNVSSPEDNLKEKDENNMVSGWDTSLPDPEWTYDDEKEEVRRYFRAQSLEDNVLKISVDKRITIGQLKKELQKHVGVAQEHFKLYKYYTNSSQEFECARMTETLTSYGDFTVMKVSLGRALLPGEYKGKVFLLEPSNPEEPARFLIDFVICQGDSVLKVKNAILKEVNARCGMSLSPELVRIRKKSWKNPQTIFLDHQIFDDDITMYPNWEFYLQTLEGSEERTGSSEELSLFIKRWRPSTYTTDPLLEIIVPKPTTDALREKLISISGIPAENVEFAKGKGTFPCDMSVLEINNELDWTQRTGDLDQKPLYIMDDGNVVYYRDKTEQLKTLTESERNELCSEETTRLKRDVQYTTSVSTSSSSLTVSRTRERGLKIYLNQTSR